MQKGTWRNVGTMIVLVVMTWVVGLIALIAVSLGVPDLFYTYGVVAATITVTVLLIVGLAEWLERKWFWRLCAAVALAYVLAVSTHEMVKAYHNSFATVGDDVDLFAYKPFADGTKAVALEEAAAYAVAEPLPVMDGATALYPLYAAFARAVYPEGDYNPWNSAVRSTTTREAYAALIKGEADLIFAAGPSDEQLQYAEAAGVELKLTPIGKEAFVFFVHEGNPVTGLATEQIRAIYSGEVRNWSALGGRHEPIKPFQRPEGSGSQTALQRLMEGKALMSPPTDNVVSGMGGIIKRTADYRNYPGAIGYSFLFYATEMVQNGQIRLLEVDGIAPSRESIQDGTYPLSSFFYAITAGSGNPYVEGLVEWILSEQGQQLVEKTGYTPIAIP